MNWWMAFDADGLLCGNYLEGVNAIPSDAVSVSEELYARVMTENDGVWKLGDDGSIKKHPFPAPSAEQIVALNTARQVELLAAASQTMTPLLISLQLGDATEQETAQARAWQAYSRALKRVDLLEESPEWPDEPA